VVIVVNSDPVCLLYAISFHVGLNTAFVKCQADVTAFLW